MSAHAKFIEEYGSDYGYDGKIDAIRKEEFGRVEGVYLDNAGAALYSDSQMRHFLETMQKNVFGNPHSLNPTSTRTTNEVDAIREQILHYFNTNSKEYSLIFTSGATAGLKLIGEYFDWSNQSQFSYLKESCHNSVIGIREYVLEKGGSFKPISIEEIERQIERENSAVSDDELNNNSKNSNNNSSNNINLSRTSSQPNTPRNTFVTNVPQNANHLFAFPAQCNFSGRKFPMTIIDYFQNSKILNQSGKNWKVLLDASSFVSTSKLDLKKCTPDFVVLSFYKIFGFPTGIGALIVKNDSIGTLKKKYFGGGTVATTLSGENYKVFRENISAKFEDGTIDYLNIIALRKGLETISALGMENISRHSFALSRYLYTSLMDLRHANGSPVCIVYGVNNYFQNHESQGPIISFNLLNPNLEYVGYGEVERLAAINNISIRTGCFCNPGACQHYLDLSNERIKKNFLEFGHVCWDQHDIIEGMPTGAVRASVPYFATFEDVTIFVEFIEKYFVSSKESLTPRYMTQDQSSATEINLEKIILYPIKSCEGMEVDEWEISEEGLLYDREWSLIDDSGAYINQKKMPQLCFIRPHIDLESGIMTVSAQDMPNLVIPLNENPEDILSVRVCGDTCTAMAYKGEVKDWFTKFCGKSVTLVRQRTTEDDTRHLSQRRIKQLHVENNGKGSATPREDQQPNLEIAPKISFVNEGQFLVINQASIDELNEKLKEKQLTDPHVKLVTYVNFRPNLVISSPEPYSEDRWQALKINDQYLGSVGPCNRCQMICINTNTGTFQKEPLLTLSDYRRDQGRILFGSLFIHLRDKSGQPFKLKTKSKIEVVS
jgi:molybdenum cofactor sulfurtransferase